MMHDEAPGPTGRPEGGPPRFPWDGRGTDPALPAFGRRERAPPPPHPAPPRPAAAPEPDAAAAPAAPRQRPWRDAAEAVLRRFEPPSREEFRKHWPAFLLRTATYSGAVLLAGSLLLAALPPILSDTSSRAVVNAPIVLVTAPIDGEVDRMAAMAGEAVSGGQVLASLRNERLDRSTLIGLQNHTEGTRISLTAVNDRIRVAEAWISRLDDTLARQRDYGLRLAHEAEREARARANAAAALHAEQAQLAARQRMLFERGVVTESVMRIAALRERAAREEVAAAEATLSRRVAERVTIEGGSYMGEGQSALGALVERRRDAVLDLDRLRVERRQLTTALAALEQQTATEARRLERLLASEVTAPSSGHVLRVFASPGQRLAAGDSVAGTVECGRAFVVAIFSIRQAHRLAPGTRVLVESEAWRAPRGGIVMQVLSRTTDRVDTNYAAPFPPLERREMYVVVEFDDLGPQRWSRGADPFGLSSPCDIGRWVSVEVKGGIVSGAARLLRQLIPVRAPEAPPAGRPTSA